jgi:hypothetical protein
MPGRQRAIDQWCENNHSIHGREVVIIDLADGLKDSLRNGDLVLADAFSEHGLDDTILLPYFFTSYA